MGHVFNVDFEKELSGGYWKKEASPGENNNKHITARKNED